MLSVGARRDFRARHKLRPGLGPGVVTNSEDPDVVYAIVRAGGRQEKVEVGSVLVVDRIAADDKGHVELAPVLLVDGDKVTSDAEALAKVTVTAEVVTDLRGPKIRIQHYRNKTGYKRRMGHRSELTRLKVTEIK
jgi:large subunit ribosomal protein L21